MSKPHVLSPLERELLDALTTLRRNVDVSTIRTSAKVLAGWDVVLEVADKALAHAHEATLGVALGDGKVTVKCPRCGSAGIAELRKERTRYGVKEWAFEDGDLLVQDYEGDTEDRGECIDSVPDGYDCLHCGADLCSSELLVSGVKA